MSHHNWGIIGLGQIAPYFVEALPDTQTLYGVAARDFARAQQFAREYHAQQAFTTYDQLLADPNIDIVYIATTHNFHYNNIKSALLAGKNVFAEKSITVNLRELNTLIEIARQRHLILMEAQTIYHMPIFPTIQAQTRELGRLRTIQISFGSSIPYQPQNRLFNPNLAGGALLDTGIYALSLMRRFVNSKPVLIATQMTPTDTGVDDQSMTMLKGSANEQIVITLNLQAKMPMSGVFTYDRGCLTIDDYNQADSAVLSIPTKDGATNNTTLYAGRAVNKMCYEINDMVHAVETHLNPTLTWTQDTMALMCELRDAWNFYYPRERHPLIQH